MTGKRQRGAPVCITQNCRNRTVLRTNWDTIPEWVLEEYHSPSDYHHRCEPCFEQWDKLRKLRMDAAIYRDGHASDPCTRVLTTRKDWECYVCGEAIPKGSRVAFGSQWNQGWVWAKYYRHEGCRS